MKTLQLILFTLLAHTICAQDWPYSLDLVPDSLKKNAHVVVHVDDGFLEVESPEKATMHTHRVYTVLNEEGKHALFFNEYSSKYVTLEDVEIKVYDAKGKLLNKYKKKELMTVSVGEGLIEDGYVTYHHFGATHFPVTVEVRMEQKFKSSFYPGFYFIGAHEGVVSSNYTVKIPQSMNLRFKAKNTDIRPLISDDAKYRTYKWSVARLKPLEHEEGTVSARSRYPYVNIVTDQFSFYGSQGSMASWKNFGEWLNQLYTGMDELLIQYIKHAFVKLLQVGVLSGRVDGFFEFQLNAGLQHTILHL